MKKSTEHNHVLESTSIQSRMKPHEISVMASLSQVPAFEAARVILSRVYWACGQNALEDEQVKYWKGVQDGLDAFFSYVSSSVISYEVLSKYEQAQEPIDDNPNRPRDEEPSIVLGGSSL